MKEKAGRNAPCPCGSGRKFKHCCLGKTNENANSRHRLDVTENILAALEGRHFGSMEEMQVFLEQFAYKLNSHPLDDFHGLSPSQMSDLLYQPFSSPHLLRFATRLDQEPDAPILTLFQLLAEAIGQQGIKTTAKGNLPRNFCREAALRYWGEEKYRERTRFGDIQKEVDFDALHTTRLVAELAGLVRKYKGRFILGRECRQLLAKDGLRTIYPRLFRTYVEQFNWAYRDGFSELDFMQQTFAFTLFLLNHFGKQWRAESFYENAFIRAFPQLLDEMDEAFSSPYVTAEDQLRHVYRWRALEHFAKFFGLIEMEPISAETGKQEYRLRTRPLFQQMVQFQQLCSTPP